MGALTFADPAVVDALTTDVPTTTLVAGATTSIVGATLVAPTDARLRYRGAGGMGYGAAFPDTTLYQATSRYPGTWGSPSQFSFEFIHTGTQFALLFKYISAFSQVRIKVDGRRVTTLTVSPGAGTAGSRFNLKVVFGSSATRRITIETSTLPFGGVFLPSGDTMVAVSAYSARTIFLGDSITGGSAANAGLGAGTYPHLLGPYIGADDPWNAAIGATGYIAAGTAVKFGDRIADVTSWSPKVVVLWGGYNDRGQSLTTLATNASAVFSAVKSGVPAAEIYVVGCWSPGTPTDTQVLDVDATLKAAAASASLPFMSPVNGKVYSAAGTQVADLGAWIGTGETGTLIGSADHIHPTDAGHARIADRMRTSLLALNTPAAPTWSVWNGTTEQPVTLDGVWNGTAIVPVTVAVTP
jgi:lysophospholipase L1-like esterase